MNETTKEHLKQYVVEKTEDSKKKETQVAGAEKDDETAQPSDADGDGKSDAEHSKKEDKDSGNKESHDFATFGIVTGEDREADREASEKIANMIEERLKTRPLPTAPPQAAGDGSAITSEQPAKTRDGESDEGMGRNGKSYCRQKAIPFLYRLSFDTTELYFIIGIHIVLCSSFFLLLLFPLFEVIYSGALLFKFCRSN